MGFVTVSRIENVHISPTVAMLEKLARALGISVREFFPPARRIKRRRPEVAMVDENTQRTRDPWSTKKKDPAPRGVHRFDRRGERPAGWQILFTCGQHHRHKEWIGPGKSDAIKAWHSRKNRVHDEPGWCPREEQRQLEATRRAREAQAVTVRQYAEQWLTAHVAHEYRERTAEQYRSTFKHHVYPAFGECLSGS